MKNELFLNYEKISRNIDKLKYVLIFFTFKKTFQEYFCYTNKMLHICNNGRILEKYTFFNNYYSMHCIIIII